MSMRYEKYSFLLYLLLELIEKLSVNQTN